MFEINIQIAVCKELKRKYFRLGKEVESICWIFYNKVIWRKKWNIS